ncbi:MAG: hypothetical protein ABIA02_00375 [Candidatus Falkowbacteria bacterium]
MYFIIKELFYILTATLIIFCAMELIHPGIVLAYININWVLIFWLVDVILILSINNKHKI